MKQFAFVNDAVKREYKDFPKETQQQYRKNEKTKTTKRLQLNPLFGF